MAPSSSSGSPHGRARGRSPVTRPPGPMRGITSPPIPTSSNPGEDSSPESVAALSGTPRVQVGRSDSPHLARRFSTLPRRLFRGMTFEEAQSRGMISDEERSSQFEDMELDEKDIKRLPKKLRAYYTKLATLKDHYEEVDQLLSGELPSTIASSFTPAHHTKSYTREIGDLEEEVSGDVPETPNWLRRGSAWKIKAREREGEASPDRHGHHPGDLPNGDREAGEGTSLLDAQKREERKERIARLALNVNTIVNVLLVAAKVVAVLYSSSISLIASLVDSALDLLSTFIILGTSWAIGIKSDRHMYPAGKRRFEPLGVLIFSVAMIASFVQVFIESFNRARNPSEEGPVDLSAVGMGTMLATIGIKAVLWIWCSRIPSSGVQALAQDAENDVWLNIMSLSFPFLGQVLHWRLLDPIGGMVLSTYIIVNWVRTLLENFNNLSGKSAGPEHLTRVLYLVTRFNPVLEIGDVECYHIGDDLIVEIDVILPSSSSLHFAHDVGETIQCVLESLEGVLRAYVHCDYSSNNPQQHTARTPLNSQSKPQRRINSPSGSSSQAPSQNGRGHAP